MSSERILPPSESKKLSLKQEIFPFADLRELRMSMGKFKNISTERLLELSFKEKNVLVPITFALQIYEANGTEIVPFHPESGYRITPEDFDLESRRRKLRKNLHPERINKNAPLVLLITTYPLDKDEEKAILLGRILGKLRCRVLAKSLYESPLASREQGYDFDGGFYPADPGSLGHLSADEHEGIVCGETVYDDTGKLEVGIGHDLLFGVDQNEIAKISISFNMPLSSLGET